MRTAFKEAERDTPCSPGDSIARIGSIPNDRARLSLIRRSSRLHNPEAVKMIYEEVVRLARIDVQQADRLARAATWIAEQLGDESCRALGYRATGHVLLMRGDYREALRFYKMALSLYRRIGNEIETGRTLYGGSLQALIYLGRYDEAFAWAMEARGIFERLGDRLRLARLDTNMGNILHRQDRFEEALRCYRRASREFKRQGEPQDVAIALRNMAVCHISLGNFSKALATYQIARSHCERNGLMLLVAEADYNIAYLHYQRGEYMRAIELYQATRVHCEKLGDPYHKALCDLDQSEMFLELNLDEEGVRLAERAASAFGTLGMRYEEAKAFTFLAVAASHQEMASLALRLFGKARRLFTREQNPVWVALIDLYQALVHFQIGRLARSRRLCADALSVFSFSSMESKAVLCNLLMARIHLRSGELDAAQRTCSAALDRIDGAESPVLAWQACFVLGQILEARGDYDASGLSYKRAHALLENLRSHLKGEELKIAFLKDKLAVYESLVWMCLEGGSGEPQKKKAFAYMEQAKSRSLADLIAFRSLELPLNIGARTDLAEKVRRLREELNCCYRQVELVETGPEKPKAARLASMRNRTRRCENDLVRALAELRAADQRFGVLQDAGTIELEAIRAALSQDSVLLEYYQARGNLYACVLGHDFLEIVPLARAAGVAVLMRLLQFQFSKFRLGTDYVRRFSGALLAASQAHLSELHSVLIAPIRRWLDARHLVIVPHDFLHYLPFQALHDGRRSLIDDVSISYAPSASVYQLCRSRPPATGVESLIFAIPDSLAPQIHEEARNVASILPNSRLFLGEQATVESLRQNGPKGRFIHLATHGLFRQDNPMFSSLRMGDSHLSLLDLYSLDLSSELVTLSGCSTGLNAVVGGDELLGLVRGLLCAGTRAILVTLWDVDDKSTADFMKLFYGNLIAGSDKAEALRNAMREIRQEYPHPYYWAPFALIGR